MAHEWQPIETSPELLRLIEKARNHVMTPEEVFEQRVSFVYGQMGGGLADSALTKDDVRRMMIRHAGRPACERCVELANELAATTAALERSTETLKKAQRELERVSGSHPEGEDPEEGLSAEHDRAAEGNAQIPVRSVPIHPLYSPTKNDS